MLKKIAQPAALVALLAGCLVGAHAQSAPTPIWFGPVTGNAEQDTLALPAVASPVRTLVFVGPARQIGPVTGDAEKDTFAMIAVSAAIADSLAL
jgi:hypothetical protein